MDLFKHILQEIAMATCHALFILTIAYCMVILAGGTIELKVCAEAAQKQSKLESCEKGGK